MRENIRQILTKATFDVFEKMFFVFLEPVEGETQRYDAVSFIDFRGRASGNVRLMMSRGLTEMMAQNMLGCAPSETTEQMIEDCAKEAANMVCGNFLRKMSEQDVFNLNLPQFAAGEQAIQPGMNAAAAAEVAVCFESEGELLKVCLSLEEVVEA
jgi:CheY-specific phosphatase CheX